MPNVKDSVTSVINERYEEHKLPTGHAVVAVCFIRVFLITTLQNVAFANEVLLQY